MNHPDHLITNCLLMLSIRTKTHYFPFVFLFVFVVVKVGFTLYVQYMPKKRRKIRYGSGCVLDIDEDKSFTPIKSLRLLTLWHCRCLYCCPAVFICTQQSVTTPFRRTSVNNKSWSDFLITASTWILSRQQQYVTALTCSWSGRGWGGWVGWENKWCY